MPPFSPTRRARRTALYPKTYSRWSYPCWKRCRTGTRTLLHDTLIGMAAEKGMKNGTLLWPVRIAMAGKAVTPGGAIEIGVLLGRDETHAKAEDRP